MIPFRYLIVSIAVVILALAAGILLGGTLIDPNVATGLDRQIKQLSTSIDNYRQTVAELQKADERWKSYSQATLPLLVTDRLTGQSVVIVTDQNTDLSTSQAARDVITESGATLAGVIEVLRPMGLADPAERSALADILGLDPSNPPADLGARAADSVAARLQLPGPSSDDLLTKLSDAGFISIPEVSSSGLVGIGGPSEEVVVVAGGAAQPAVDPAAFLLPMMTSLLAASPALPVVAGEPTVTAAPFVALIRQGTLNGSVSTVDDLDTVFGLFSLAVAAQEQVARPGQGTNFGVKPGANSLFPAP